MHRTQTFHGYEMIIFEQKALYISYLSILLDHVLFLWIIYLQGY